MPAIYLAILHLAYFVIFCFIVRNVSEEYKNLIEVKEKEHLKLAANNTTFVRSNFKVW